MCDITLGVTAPLARVTDPIGIALSGAVDLEVIARQPMAIRAVRLTGVGGGDSVATKYIRTDGNYF